MLAALILTALPVVTSEINKRCYYKSWNLLVLLLCEIRRSSITEGNKLILNCNWYSQSGRKKRWMLLPNFWPVYTREMSLTPHFSQKNVFLKFHRCLYLIEFLIHLFRATIIPAYIFPSEISLWCSFFFQSSLTFVQVFKLEWARFGILSTGGTLTFTLTHTCFYNFHISVLLGEWAEITLSFSSNYDIRLATRSNQVEKSIKEDH